MLFYPKKWWSLKKALFRYCSSLKTISLSSQLGYINTAALEDTYVSVLSIPSEVGGMGPKALGRCDTLIFEDSEYMLEVEDNSLQGKYKCICFGRSLFSRCNVVVKYIPEVENIIIGPYVKDLRFMSRIVMREPFHSIQAFTPPYVNAKLENKVLLYTKLIVPNEAEAEYREDEFWGKFVNIRAVL